VDLIILQAIQELTLEGLPEHGIELDDDCIIHPVDREVRELSENILRPFVGMIHHEAIISHATAVNYVKQVSDVPVDDESARRFLLRTMAWVQHFLFSLWLVKDNSGNTGDGHLLLAEVGRGICGFWSQRPGVLNFTAECHRIPTVFSKDEVEEAVILFRRMKEITPQGEWRFDAPRPSGLVFDSRMVRTIYYAQAARASAEIGVKLAFQCLCFESLFASSADSISHRVSERAAILVGTSGPESRAVYADIRTLYSARSNVVHGEPIKARSIPKLREVAQRADSHLRQAIRRILETGALLELFSKNDAKRIDEHFLRAIFPGEPPAAATGEAPPTTAGRAPPEG